VETNLGAQPLPSEATARDTRCNVSRTLPASPEWDPQDAAEITRLRERELVTAIVI
jgi:hypothetical protein